VGSLCQTQTFFYDALDRITTMRFAPPGPPPPDVPVGEERALGRRIDYDHDASGNLVNRHDNTGTTSFVYDELNRLTRQSGPATTVDYTYDAAGNPDRRNTTYSYDLRNQLTRLVDHHGQATTFEYNDRGLRATPTTPTA
jgi:YD repeat-containing protein